VVRFVDGRGEPQEWLGPAETMASSHGPGDVVVLWRGRGEEPRLQLDGLGPLWAGALAALVVAWTFAGVAWLLRRADHEHAPALVGGCLAVIGVPFLVAGVALAVDSASLFRTGTWASGSIVNGAGETWRLIREGRSTGLRPAIVQMTTASGRAVEFTDTGFDASFVAAGAQVDVLHPARRPHAGRIYEPLWFWLPSAVLGVVGAALVGGGAMLRLRSRSRSRPRSRPRPRPRRSPAHRPGANAP
jgi:hypothetical protein